MRVRKVVVGAVVVTCLAACTSGSGEPAKPQPTQEVVRTIDPAEATAMKLGEDLEIVAELPSTMGKQDTSFRGFTADGKVLGSVSLPDKPRNDGMVGGELTTQAYPVLYDMTTEEFTVLDHRKRERNTAVWTIVGSGDFVVWLESPETTASSSAVAIYSYDRRSKKVAELFSTDDPDGIMNGGDDLVVAGGTAYFSRFACCHKQDRANAAVYAVPIDGSAPAKVLVKGGTRVNLAGGSLTYEVEDKRFSRDLETGETKALPVSPHAKEPGFCGAELDESFETLCKGSPSMVEGESLVDDASLTITETAGRTTVLQPFPVEADSDSVPRHVVPIGPWVGVTMTDAAGADRLFLVDLESRTVKAFPRSSAFDALNDDNTQALLRIERTGMKAWPQLVVHIPSVS